MGNDATDYGSNLVEYPSKLTVSIDGGNTLLETIRISETSDQVIDLISSTIKFPSGSQIGQYGNYNDENEFSSLNLSFWVINLNKLNET